MGSSNQLQGSVQTTLQDKRAESQNQTQLWECMSDPQGTGTCKHPQTGRVEMGRPSTGPGARSEPTPACKRRIIPYDMELNPGLLGGAGLDQGGLGVSGRPSQSDRADRMGDLENYEAFRLEQGGGDKGEGRTSASGLAGSSSRQGTQGLAHGTGIPSRSGLSDFSSPSSCYR